MWRLVRRLFGCAFLVFAGGFLVYSGATGNDATAIAIGVLTVLIGFLGAIGAVIDRNRID